MTNKNRSLERRYEGTVALTTLLEQSGCRLNEADILEEFRCGVEEGSEPSDIIPLLWECEPQFQSPEAARRTFSNLFGLWDLIHKEQVGDLITLIPATDIERPLTPAYTEQLWKAFGRLSDADFKKVHSRFENQSGGLGQYLLNALSSTSSHGMEISFQLAFESWWIIDQVETSEVPLPSLAQCLSTQTTLDEGSIDREPALGQLVKTALWEEAADDEPLDESEIPTIEHALRVVRNALLGAYAD